MTVFEWLFVGLALLLAWQAGAELLVVWYSGAEATLSLRDHALLWSRLALFLLAAVGTIVLALLTRHRAG